MTATTLPDAATLARWLAADPERRLRLCDDAICESGDPPASTLEALALGMAFEQAATEIRGGCERCESPATQAVYTKHFGTEALCDACADAVRLDGQVTTSD